MFQKNKKKVIVLPGDGIGVEIMAEAIKVLKAVEKKFNRSFDLQEFFIGLEAYKRYGTYLPDEVVQAGKKADAILVGATGVSGDGGRELILEIREQFRLFSNVRPMKGYSPFTGQNFDFIIVRELSSGIYFGRRKEADYQGLNHDTFATDTEQYRVREIERISRVAFDMAKKRQKRVYSVDKANVLATSRLWRKVVEDVAKEYPEVTLHHMYVDNAAAQIIANPSQFDIMLTSNFIGDILSDEAAALVGSLGMIPSASFGESKNALYEPIHGSAPDIAGKGIANPTAMILSAAMMLRFSCGMAKEADAIEHAVAQVSKEGFGTVDVKQKKIVRTKELGDLVVKKIF